MEKIELGKTIKECRNRTGLTQKQLADKLGKAESSIRMWELGKNKPSPEAIGQLSEILNVPYFALMMKAGYLDQRDENNRKVFEDGMNKFVNDLEWKQHVSRKYVELLDVIEHSPHIYIDGVELPKTEREKISDILKIFIKDREKNYPSKEDLQDEYDLYMEEKELEEKNRKEKFKNRFNKN